jgi:glycosyltransferase involved in cell wall biosynthesis
MSRILLCGLCPLPGENTLKSYGPGIRTWQFAWSLARAGHEVRVLAMKIPDAYRPGEGMPCEERDGVRVERLTDAELLHSDRVAETLRTWQPDAVVGATLYGSYALARCRPEAPFWADQFGHVMAEAQAKAALDRSDGVLAYFWRLVQPTLAWADRMSVVSERQRYAAIGELGAAGRLSFQTCGYEFVSVIPCAQIPCEPAPSALQVRGSRIPEDAFVVLWSGSYNTWSDAKTLFLGLEGAMRRHPRVRFVSTGGEIPGHDERTYRELVERVEASPFRSRFHLAGWVPAEHVHAYWNAADLGVLTEQPIYEGLLGSKNRVVQWLGCGLPVAYNKIGDLGELLEERRLGLTFPVGSAEGLTRQVLWAAEHPAELKDMARRAREYVARELSFEGSTAGLVAWAHCPSHAPDAALKGRIASPADFAPPVQTSVAAVARQVPGVRDSQGLRRIWSRLRAWGLIRGSLRRSGT